MTDENTCTKLTNKNNEQETSESDIEQEESICSDDRSNVTTDDEFYNELMSAPAEHEDHLIPDQCKVEITGIEHLISCLNRRYNASPIFFTGTLKSAIKEAFNSKEIHERRPLLIYINNDKSMYSNLFCKQLLCHEKMIEYLLNNYVLWAWDVTFPSNGENLNEIFKNSFSQWNANQQIGTKSIEEYPMLIGIDHNRNGDFQYKYLIHGSDNRPNIDEFLAYLIEFKDRFDFNEYEYEKQMKIPTHHFNYSTVYHNDYDSSRFLTHNNVQMNFLTDLIPQLNMNSNDGDDEDDDERTPTVNLSSLKFPPK